jgi:hypothetical protein
MSSIETIMNGLNDIAIHDGFPSEYRQHRLY